METVHIIRHSPVTMYMKDIDEKVTLEKILI